MGRIFRVEDADCREGLHGHGVAGPGKDDRCVAGDDAEFAVAGLRKTPKESGRSEV
ncbi:hypothetical protein GCM10028781_10940 [Nostocoides australiense]